MSWRGFFEGIGDLSEWAFGGLELLGQGFNGIGVANVFWMLVIAGMNVYWIMQMRAQSKRGEK
jgi:hypothetical protein